MPTAHVKNPAFHDRRGRKGRKSVMRKFGVALAALGAFMAVALPGSSPRADEQKPLNITFIIYTEAGNVFWNPALRGVQDAAKAFNANVDIQYADADPVKQNNIIETAIANKV